MVILEDDMCSVSFRCVAQLLIDDVIEMAKFDHPNDAERYSDYGLIVIFKYPLASDAQ